MIAIKAHFDGKVIVPDEPVDLPINESLVINVEPVGETKELQTNFDEWLGLAGPEARNPTPRFTSDDDLWKKDGE